MPTWTWVTFVRIVWFSQDIRSWLVSLPAFLLSYFIMDVSCLDSYRQLIQYNKENLIELLKSILNIHYENFRQIAIYAKIKDLSQSLNYEEQRILEDEIQSHFICFTHNLRQLCPAITRKEIFICCLSFYFSMKTIALCFGYTSTNTIRQHKIRIKNKMTVDSDNAFLFDFIFSS